MEQTYLTYFQSLHTNKTKGQIAPHKAILLLSIIDQIEQGIIKSNHITLTDPLEEQFMINWSRYVGNSDIFQPKVGTPFWHLNYEPFWKLIPYEGGDETIRTLQQGNPYSPSTIKKYIKYAEIDMELFLLLQDPSFRARCRVELLKNNL